VERLLNSTSSLLELIEALPSPEISSDRRPAGFYNLINMQISIVLATALQ